jgi:hypothetical protein
MKTKLVLLTAAIAMSHSTRVFAQSSNATITTPATAPASDPAVTTAATTNTATIETNPGIKPVLKYTGFVHGPAADFHGSEQSAQIGSGGAFDLDSRAKFGVKLNETLETGAEIRFTTTFNPDKMKVTNGSSRLYASFKNVYKDELVAVGLIPRIVLPTSDTSHNTHMTFSPEFIVNVDIAPKNSRFTFNTGLQVIQHLYSESVSAASAGARQTTIDPWAEVDYQLNPKVQLMVSYWPDWATSRSNSAPTERAHEIDVGAYIEVAKGWQLNPYLATDFQGLKNASLEKNTQINLAISGTVL